MLGSVVVVISGVGARGRRVAGPARSSHAPHFCVLPPFCARARAALRPRSDTDAMSQSVDLRRRAGLRGLVTAVRSRGGVARVSSLQRDGHARHRIRLALEEGHLLRVRRDWVALPGADAELIDAARRGVILSCVTRARRLGLWVLREEGIHVAADPHAKVTRVAGDTVHWSTPIVPRVADALEDGIENSLVLVAACQPFERALAVWESAYRKGMVDPLRLSRLELPPAARALLAEAQPFSDSGLETIFVSRLKRFGVAVRSQMWIAGRYVDHLIGKRLVVQVDGGHHVDAQRMADNEHDAALRLLGYTVIRVGFRQVMDDWPTVQWLIMQALAQGLHRQA